jgi:MAP kinase interacting serine/threonine kinase
MRHLIAEEMGLNDNGTGMECEAQGPLAMRSTSPPRPTTLLLNNTANEIICRDVTNGNKPTQNRRRKKKRASERGVKKFDELYEATGENLGEGSFGSVLTYRNVITNKEFAVKIIHKNLERSRHKVLKEVEIFHHCKGHENILQLIEYFEEDDKFYLVFEKMEGGTLLENIERRGHMTEQEASLVVRDIAKALDFLHNKGIAHRDLKPENVLCERKGQLVPLRISDFDLGSGIQIRKDKETSSPCTTPELLTPVGSAEFMAPEVVDVWVDQAWSYDKKCDLWSLGIILYIMLCGYPPFYGQCGNDCGWERGESCQACQDMLFNRIQDGFYDFPEEEWGRISEEARDLIHHLLVRDPHLRYSAAEVLKHPWIAMESSMAPLATPRILQRNNSIKELEAFAESAVAVNRLILRHLSISEAHAPPVFSLSSAMSCSSGFHPLGDGVNEPLSPPIFQIGGSDDEQQSDDSSSKDSDCGTGMWMGLSPPGCSGLARRRAQGRLSSTGSKPRSPPKTPSAIF